jgi:hypothetical protein
VDGVDDLGIVDALEVDRGDGEVAVAELALDDHQRDALIGHLHRMSAAELMRREPPPHPRRRCRPAQIRTRGRAGPRPPHMSGR